MGSPSNLLIDEPPLQVLPSLAEEIGLNQALFMQQLHYLLQYSQNEKPDESGTERTWVYYTYSDLHEKFFPFWSTRTIKRIVDDLQERGLIIRDNHNRKGNDNTPWYAIDYQELRNLTQGESSTSGDQDAEDDEPVSSEGSPNPFLERMIEDKNPQDTREFLEQIGREDLISEYVPGEDEAA